MDQCGDIPVGKRITGDISCIGCGYNLRTLAESGVCPECGLTVSETLQHALARADLDWLKSLENGATLLAWSALSALVIGVVAGPTGMLTPGSVGAAAGLCVSGFGYLVAYCMGALGTVEIASREPGAPPFGWRSIPGAALMCPVATLVLSVVVLATLPFRPPIALVATVAPMIVAVLLLWPTLLALHVHPLAKRGAASGVARLAKVTAWVGGVSLALFVLCILAAAVLHVFVSDVGDMVRAVHRMGFLLALPGLLALVVLTMVLMFRLRRVLNRALALAQASGRAVDSVVPLAEPERVDERV